MGRNEMILLVEDDLVDALTVKRALDEIGATKTLIHLCNGEEALDYLRSDVNQLPTLILLDLNMPKMNGIDFIEAIKVDDRLSQIPVIVLTTSQDDADIDKSFQLNAAGYMIKPVGHDQFIETIRAIEAYWRLSRVPQ